MIYMYESCRDLSPYRHSINLVETSTTHPSKIIIIIGESFAKSHSSIYGYDKETNPYLTNLIDSGSLVKFDNCVSPYVSTTPVFKCIMSTYSMSSNDKKKWYEHETVFDALQSEYQMVWASNQKSYGTYDCVQSLYANLSDSVWFTDQHMHGECYDEVLIPVVSSLNETILKDKRSILFINIKGQHESFNLRYPDKWNRFVPNDYSDHLENQRTTMAYYDNATLYNDYVISRILDIFQDDEVIAFYFPDHGLDIFETDKDYCGHSRKIDESSIVVGCQIPFFIYMPKKFRQKNPEIVERVIHSKNKKFNTENFIYSLIDLCGWKIQENNRVEQYSLFR